MPTQLLLDGIWWTDEVIAMNEVILGHAEEIGILSLGVDKVLAKVDTGAFSGALHCTDIRLSKDGQTLSFNPLGKAELRTRVTDFKVSRVRSASGHESRRYILPITLHLQGQNYHTVIGIASRTDMTYKMLLGRRFLREHNMLVDVRRGCVPDKEWKGTRK